MIQKSLQAIPFGRLQALVPLPFIGLSGGNRSLGLAILAEVLDFRVFSRRNPPLVPEHRYAQSGATGQTLYDVGIVDDGNSQILISIYTRTDQGGEYASDFIASLALRLYSDLRTLKTCC